MTYFKRSSIPIGEEWVTQARRELSRKQILHEMYTRGEIDHKQLNEELIALDNKPMYRPVGEEGLCSACRKELRKDGDRVYHPKGILDDKDRCPVGIAPRSDHDIALETLRAKLAGTYYTGFQPEAVDWSELEIEVPDYYFFSKELMSDG